MWSPTTTGTAGLLGPDAIGESSSLLKLGLRWHAGNTMCLEDYTNQA